MSPCRYQNFKFIKLHDRGLKGPGALNKPDKPEQPDELNNAVDGLNDPNDLNGLNGMNLFFALLSIVYIFVIFFFADSSAVSMIAPYNPSSLLHIPLYGILTVLIVFALVPVSSFPFSRIRRLNENDPNGINGPNGLTLSNAPRRFLIAGLISILVALADEYHQIFIPTREGSFTDVLLDAAGIALAVLFTFRLYRIRRTFVKKWTH
jgi:hypothetical protein